MAGILPETPAHAVKSKLGRRPIAALRSLFGRAVPGACLLCGADCAGLLCPPCAADLPRLPTARCPRCAEPTTHGEHCGRCLHQPPHFDATLALFAYAFPADQLLQAFKYGGQLLPGAWFASQLTAAALAWGQAIDAVVALPLHPERLAERGFNQAQELARPLAAALGVPLLSDACLRQKATPPQAELPHTKERRRNVRNAFACTRDLSGLRLLLVDDVMTTGASLDECARTLKMHGATWVGAAVAARALKHG